MRNSNFVKGVEIIAKYIPEEEKNKFALHSEHDQLWFGADEWVTNENDRIELEELGWFIDEGSWSAWT